MRSILLIIIVALSLGGCLTNSSEVSVADASLTRYQSYTCQKLRTESYAASAKATKLANVEDHNEVAAQISQLRGQMIQFMIGSFSCLSSSSKAVDIRPTFALLKQLKNKKARN